MDHWLWTRDAKRDLNPREFSFSFSNFENFRERGQRLGSRIYEGNPQNFSKFENENEGINFENSRGFSYNSQKLPFKSYS